MALHKFLAESVKKFRNFSSLWSDCFGYIGMNFWNVAFDEFMIETLVESSYFGVRITYIHSGYWHLLRRVEMHWYKYLSTSLYSRVSLSVFTNLSVQQNLSLSPSPSLSLSLSLTHTHTHTHFLSLSVYLSTKLCIYFCISVFLRLSLDR